MSLIQFFLLLFFFYAVNRVFFQYRLGDVSVGQFVLWVVVWVGAAVVVLKPNLTSQLAAFVGIGRGADLVVYATMAVLVFAVFRLMARLEKMNKEITVLTRAVALKNEKLKVKS